MAAAWVLGNGAALVLHLVGGGLVVIGMPEADQAAGLVTGLAGLEGRQRLDAQASSAVAWPTDLSDTDTYEQVLALVKQGKRAAATKLVHTRTHLSVRQSLRTVEAVIATEK